MIKFTNKLSTLSIFVSVSISACGGGGDVAAGLTDFSVVPSEYTITALKGDTLCEDTAGATRSVTIVGGTPPYRLVSSNPQRAIINTTELSGKNPTFTVTSGKGCADSISILVLDYHSRSTVFSFSIEAGEEETSTPTPTPATGT